MKLDLLWTDKCFLLLLVICIVLVIKSCRKIPVRKAFGQIFSQPVAVSAAIVLLFFLVIAVLDSVHIKSTATLQTTSLLDRLLSPLGKNAYEKTYSAPLSLHLYSTTTNFV
jgi:peptide/nickel transport system permease protein